MEPDLVEFLHGSFRSVWSLELLLALHGQPKRIWTSVELIAELRSSEAVVRQGVGDLLAAGLIVVEGDQEVRYNPATADQGALVERLAEVYRVRPSAVRRHIVQRPTDKLRDFADAFRIVKD